MRWYNKLKTFATICLILAILPLFFIGLVFALFIVLIIRVVARISTIPSYFGSRLRVEGWTHNLIDLVFDIEGMKDVREDFFWMFARQVDLDAAEKSARYYYLRKTERGRQIHEKRLKNGEIVLSVTFGVAGVLSGVFLPTVQAGLLLTFLAIGLSGMAFFRTIVIDIIAYEPALYIEDDWKHLVLRAAWNEGAISGRTAFLIPVLSVLKSFSRSGYDLAMNYIESEVDSQYHPDGRWESGP